MDPSRPVRGKGRGRLRTRSPSGGRTGGRSPDRSAVSPFAGSSSSSSGRSTASTSSAMSDVSSASSDMQVDFSNLTVTPSHLTTSAELAETGYPRGASRGVRHGELTDEERMKFGLVVTRPEGRNKMGQKGREIPLYANYYKLKSLPSWVLHHYHLYFDGVQEDSTSFKKRVLKEAFKDTQIGYMFDGMQLYTAKRIETEVAEDLTFTVVLTNKKDNQQTTVSFHLKYVGEVLSGDPQYTQLYNLLIRKSLFNLDLLELGRNFFDKNAEITVPEHKLVLWPGYVTSMRTHEKDVLLCVEVTHKVLRTQTVLEVIQGIKNRNDVNAEFRDTIVMTKFNSKTYHVDEVDFSLNPRSTFAKRDGTEISFADYYKEHHQLVIKDMTQPLLISRPSKKDIHRGVDPDQKIMLIPELCISTGLTDAMRANFRLMKELSTHLHQDPEKKMKAIEALMTRMKKNEKIKADFTSWGLEFDNSLVKLNGRVLSSERMIFGDNAEQVVDQKGDFTPAFRSCKMLSTVNLVKWAIIVPQRDAAGVDNLIRSMSKVANPLNMKVSNPVKTINLPDSRVQSYLRSLNDVIKDVPDLQMLFVILPNNKLETYAAVKKRLAVEQGILSQCFLAKNVTAKGLMSIATKVVVQMNAKLGGEPWTIKLPLKSTMFVGFDVYHGAKGPRGTPRKSLGAMVATFSPNFTKYFSTTSWYKDDDEMSQNTFRDMEKCLKAYGEENGGDLPERIFVYRDGVSDGQIKTVFEVELNALKKALAGHYEKMKRQPPKLTFIIVTKKINTRLFQINGPRLFNPGPGTVVDDVVTLPERYDFFLISCAARQGTVSPCSYNVIHDESGFEPDRIQLITYKLCHMYFNWSGTIAVPAPCQYAHKLAYLTGMAYDGSANDKLSKLLHFL